MTGTGFDGTVVIAAANGWDGLRMADRQLAEALAAHRPVLYVEPPTSIATRRRKPELAAMVRDGRLRVVHENLARLMPEALPGLTRPGVTVLNSRLLALQIRRAIRELGGTLHAVIDARVLSPVLGHCGERMSVYWAQDDFVGLAPLLGLNARRLRAGERRIANSANLIVAANPSVAGSVERDGHDVQLIPFGCDYEHFATPTVPAADVTLSRPMAMFMGHVGDRIDVEMLTAVAESGINLLIVGPQHSKANMSPFAKIMDRDNVQWLGAKDFEDLPSYLAHAEVGILPYNRSQFNIGSFPLKTLEYLASGLPVVAVDLPAIRWLDSPDIKIARDATVFADEVVALVKQGRDPVGDERRQGFARRHSWPERAAAFDRLL